MKPRKRQDEVLQRVPGAYCWNCGEQKDRSQFGVDQRQPDGLTRECRHCAEMRARAAELDREAGRPPVKNGRLDGDRKKRHEWHQEALAAASLANQARLRGRPRSGLQPPEGWGARAEQDRTLAVSETWA